MSAIDSAFLSKWFTGKALVNAQEALNLLNESITLGYWAPKASVKVPAAMSKSNVAKKLSDSSEEINAIEKDYDNAAQKAAWSLKHNLYFGSIVNLSAMDLPSLMVAVTTPEARVVCTKAMELVADFAPVLAAIAKLEKESEANKKLAKAKADGNPTGICACCFRAQKVKPDGTMFQHGYERPGIGYIVGGCPGSSFKPYAVS